MTEHDQTKTMVARFSLQRAGRRWPTILSVALGCAALAPGCQDAESTWNERASVAPSSIAEFSVNYLAMAMRHLQALQRHDATPGHRQMLDHLAKWLESQEPDPDWLADPLFHRLPDRFETIKSSGNLPRLAFDGYDVFIIQEAIWMRATAQRIVSFPTEDPSLSEWLTKSKDSLGTEAANDLADAARLFDWSVRNVQLEPLDKPTGAGNKEAVRAGARHYAWESLLLGRGNAWARSRIFILLARQLGIHVVMLAVQETADEEPAAWLPAALIGSQLYLFDMALGLPIPGSDGQGIATLQQVIDEPELLRQLDLPPDRRYPIRRSKLDNIVALIDATPAYLSQRMKLLETHLPGDERLILTVSPALLARELRKLQGVNQVMLWTVPYDVFLHKSALANDPVGLAAAAEEHKPFLFYAPLAYARHAHFRGIVDNLPGRLGARSFYLQCLVPEREIQQLEVSQHAMRLLGQMGSLPEDADQRAELLERIQESMTQIKQTASYWLGLILSDSGEHEAAVNYFKKRTLEAAPDGKWSAGARYNLARSYEAMGLRENDLAKLQTAHDYYLADEGSPQQHGNQLRARRLASLLKDRPPADPEQPNS